MAEIALDTVCKRYPTGVQALRNLSLRVADGELVVLVGPSGCGKTTALRLIAGLESPTSGTISIGGRSVNQVPPKDRKVAMVFQRPALYPHMTVRRNLEMGLRISLPLFHRMDTTDRVAETAELLEIEGLLERLPQQLSGGEQQRVALGRAIIRRPDVFLLDEPLSHLDVSTRFEMRRQLHLLYQRLGTTMVYVTHDRDEALGLAGRLIVMHQGEVQQEGSPSEIASNPRNRFIAQFMGSPVSFVDGEVTHVNGVLAFVSSLGSFPVPAKKAEVWNRYSGRRVSLGYRCREEVATMQEVHLFDRETGLTLDTG